MKSNNLIQNNSITTTERENTKIFFIDDIAYKSISHQQVLDMLLMQIVTIDFLMLAFPELEKILERINDIESKILSYDGKSDTSPETKSLKDELRGLHEKKQKFKITNDTIIVIAIENLLAVAKLNSWSICKNGDFIYLYNGEFWKAIEKDDLKSFLGKAGEKMGITKYKARYCKFKDLLFDQFMSAAYMPAPIPEKGKVLINLKNGTFEINPSQGNRLRPFNPLDFIKYQLPFSYDPNAKAPLFTQYCDRVLPDPFTRNVLAEYLGYIFIRHSGASLKLEKVLLIYGTGANGKSVLFEVLNALLGPDNVSNYSLSSITTEQNGHYRAMLHNKLLNYATEINGKMESSIFKQIASGEPLSARLLYGNPMIITDYAKLIFNCNELPREVEHTHAFFRRFLIIPFNVTIPESEQDHQLHTKIIANELSGVFNWMLEGLERLLEQKRFTESPEVAKALEDFKMESDTVHSFISENDYRPHPTESEPLRTLFSEYRATCINDGNHAVSKKNFSKRLKLIGFTIQRISMGMVVYCLKN